MACKGCEEQIKGLKVAIGVRGSVFEVSGGFSFRLEVYLPGDGNKIRELHAELREPIKTREIALDVMIAERTHLVEQISKSFSTTLNSIMKHTNYKEVMT